MRRSLSVALLLLSLAAGPAGAKGRAPAAGGRSSAAVKAERIRAYEEARAEAAALASDPKRSRFRHHWLALAKRLDAMADRQDHPRRCEALFVAGRLFTGLAEVSYLADDRRAAVDRYRRLGRGCADSTLADDALLRAGELLAPTDPAAARFELERLLERHGRSDSAPKARELAARLKGAERRAPSRAEPEKAAVVAVAEPEPKVAAGKDPAPAARAPAAPASAPVHETRAASAAPAKAEVRPDPAPVHEAKAASAAPATAEVRPDPAPAAESPSPDTDIDFALTAAAFPKSGATGAAEPAATSKAATPAPSAAPEPPAATAQGPVAAPEALDGSRLARLAALERSASAELSLSTLAGLKVRRVVIDPGHGGRDVGAVGKRGTHEAEITLAIARKLKKRLQAMGLEVLLTRDSDKTVSLEARTAFANERRADLFLSIHCNAARSRKLRGVETYTLNLNSDNYAMRLAARENAGSERAVGDLQLILADLATKANTDDSVRLAASIQSEAVSRLSRRWEGVRDLGTKQALFFVLLGAKMPAVLFEASFLSHPEEELRLRSDAYQEEVAAGIAAGVQGFITDREAVARAGAF